MSGWRRRLQVAVVAACAALAGAPQASESHREPAAHLGVQHALGILEYVGGDYEGAVDAAGRIRHAAEYGEQQHLLSRAEKLLAGAAPKGHASLLQDMRSLRAACDARVAPTAFVLQVRRLHRRIVDELDIELTPRFVPSLAVGRIVYAQSCVVCHGEDGAARTPQAATFDPRPVDFRDASMTARLSPYRAFSVVTFGVPGTAMASFEALPEDERWAVAFWVLALRHARPGGLAAATAGVAATPGPTLRELALATDADLARQSSTDAGERERQVARWRWSLPLEIGD